MWSGIKFISFSVEGSGRCGLGLSSLVFRVCCGCPSCTEESTSCIKLVIFGRGYISVLVVDYRYRMHLWCSSWRSGLCCCVFVTSFEC